jgi:hypothetical protein
MATSWNGRLPSNRELKRLVAGLLQQNDFASAGETICRMPARRVVNPLFSLFCDRIPLVRWRAVTVMGAVVSRLADVDPESARVVMRRFMWNLNEESGGIGWGCPEAMGETMARNPRLAAEYGCILVSYLNPEGNFIDHPALQEGVLWGFGRLAEANPSAVRDSAVSLAPFLSSAAPVLRGLAVWAAGCSASVRLSAEIEKLTDDSGFFEMYDGENLVRRSVGQLARQALCRMRAKQDSR